MADFLNALADWIAGRAALERSSPPYQLFAHAVVEVRDAGGEPANYAGPYTVLRAYGGDAMGNDPSRHLAVQVYTVGTVAAQVMAQAESVFAALLDQRASDDDGNTPVRGVDLADGWHVVVIDNARPPGLIGRDATGRIEVVSNFDVVYRKT